MRYSLVSSALFAAVVLALPTPQDTVYEHKTVQKTVYVTPDGTPIDPVAAAPAPVQEVAPAAEPVQTQALAPVVEPTVVDQPPAQPQVKSSTDAPVVDKPATTPSNPSGGSDTGDVPSDLKEFAARALEAHNIERRKYGAPDLKWDNTLYEHAAANAKACVWKEDAHGEGQNIGAGSTTIEAQVKRWINDEAPLYPGFGSEPDMGNFMNWGHFSQGVWKETTHVGCWVEDCTGKYQGPNALPQYYGVCNYSPPGNFAGRYSQNVGPLSAS
ncbi:MAG: hypothetical protein M1825_005492 [Sarcosagium campestre]|nr:MAG: hypothetical protein M1825_005492 [Sarcosagium campestre]